MNRWLLKSDPETYSWKDLCKVKKETWDGVANPLALKHLRSVKSGDLLFIYHTGPEKSIVGIAEAVRPAYPSKSRGQSPKGDCPLYPKLAVIDIAAKQPLPNPVSLAAVKQNRQLSGWELVRFSRLSVMPVSDAQWDEVLRLSRNGKPDSK